MPNGDAKNQQLEELLERQRPKSIFGSFGDVAGKLFSGLGGKFPGREAATAAPTTTGADTVSRDVQGRVAPPSAAERELAARVLASRAAAAAAGTGGGATTLTSTSRTRQSPALSPKLLPEALAVQEQRKQAAMGDLAGREAEQARQSQVLANWAQRNEEDAQRYGKEARGLMDQFQKTQDDLMAARDRIEAAEIDPDRLLSRMTTGQQVVATIAAALSRFSSIGTKGFVGLVDKAVDRDVAMQRERIRNVLNAANITERQARFLFQQQSAAEGQLAQAMRDKIQIEVAQNALNVGTLDARAKAADIISAISEREVGLKQQTIPRTTGTTTTRQVPAKPKGIPGGLKMDAPTLRQLQKDISPIEDGLDLAEQFLRKVSRLKTEFPLKGKDIPQSESREVQFMVRKLALASRSMLGDTGPIRNEDFKAFDFISDGRVSKKSDLQKRVRELQRGLRRKRVRLVSTATRGPESFAAQALKDAAILRKSPSPPGPPKTSRSLGVPKK
jgi:hypothetical protein